MNASSPTRRRWLALGLSAAATAATAATPFAARRASAAPAALSLVVPYAAGGASDVLARHVAPLLAQAVDAPVVVENLPGASGTIAAHKVLAAPADGRTLFVVSSSETIVPPMLLRSARFQATDFSLLTGALTAPLALIGRPGLGAASFDSLLDRVLDTRRPPLSCGHLGAGSVQHLAAEHFIDIAGAALTLVPYRGGAPLLTDLAGEQLDLALMPLAGPLLQVVHARKLHVYGVSAAGAGTPAAQQHGLLSSRAGWRRFDHSAWLSFAAPQAVPEPVAQRLNLHLNAALASPAVQQLALQMGASAPVPASLEDAARFYAEQIRSMQLLSRRLGLTPE
jgi:tripartite-type tricarboxylate transporter receptor subunit TctC